MIIDGKAIAAQRLENLKAKISGLGFTPKLKVILVGQAQESQLYVRMKAKRASEIGVDTEIIQIQETGDKMQVRKLEAKIRGLSEDDSVNGILVQLPLPVSCQSYTREILEAIDPAKDVDCLTSTNMGLLAVARPRFYPATVKAVLITIQDAIDKIQDTRDKIQEKKQETGDWILGNDKYLLGGLNVTMVGRSDIVGKPTAIALANLGATVTVCNSKTKDLRSKTKMADILVSATGVPYLIKKDMVKNGAIVIDVGINAKDGKVVGDVEPEVETVAGAMTPVPGGIGPLTISSLLENVVLAVDNTDDEK